MLTQYKLTLQPEKPCSPRPEWAYRLYAALLAETSQDFAVSVHQSGDAGESVSAPYAARPAMDDQFAGRGERGSTRASY